MSGLLPKLNLKPLMIPCPDCRSEFQEWWQLIRHWRLAWRRPDMFGPHFKPRKRPVDQP